MILAKKKNSALWYPYIPLCSSWVKFLINLKIEKWLDYFLCSDVCLTQWYAVRRKSIGNSWQLYVRFAWLEKAVIWLFLFTIESNPDEVVTAKENVWKSVRENKDALQRLKKKINCHEQATLIRNWQGPESWLLRDVSWILFTYLR